MKKFSGQANCKLERPASKITFAKKMNKYHERRLQSLHGQTLSFQQLTSIMGSVDSCCGGPFSREIPC
jgi:hypothetical protein